MCIQIRTTNLLLFLVNSLVSYLISGKDALFKGWFTSSILFKHPRKTYASVNFSELNFTKINQFSIKSNFIFLTFWTRLIWTKNHTLLLQKYKPSQSFHLTESIFLALFVLKNISWTDHSLYFCLHNVTGWICSWWEVFWSSNLTSKIFETTSSLPLLWFF